MKQTCKLLQKRIDKTEMLFVTDVNKYALTDLYLKSFPEGTNPIFKTRSEYHCNTCFDFIRNVGRCIDENGESIFRIKDLQSPFDIVFEKLADYVEQHNPIHPFLTNRKISTESSIVKYEDDNQVYKFYHLFYDFEEKGKYFDKNAYDKINDSKHRIETLTILLNDLVDHIDKIEYIASLLPKLYRGNQYIDITDKLIKLLKEYSEITNEKSRKLFVCKNWNHECVFYKRQAVYVFIDKYIKTNSIEDAEKLYLQTVSPENYRRIKTLASQIELEKAINTLKEHNLVHSLYRKHATIADIPNDYVIWEQPKDILDDLLTGIETKDQVKIPKNIQTLTFDEFLNKIKSASKIEVVKDNKSSSFVCAISACQYPDATPIFKWRNHFGWSFMGGLSDATLNFREKVKRWGGNINARFRISLIWYATDDLDLHLETPKTHIYFDNKSSYNSNWQLDIDMNRNRSVMTADEPVENIFTNQPEDGNYLIYVHQYCRRNIAKKDHFFIEIEFPGFHKIFKYPKRLPHNLRVDIGEFKIKNGALIEFKPTNSVIECEAGDKRKELVNIEYVLHHEETDRYFFVSSRNNLIEKDTSMRGFFNEFLDSRFSQFKRVFEQLGDKSSYKIDPNGLTGFGISKNHPRIGDMIFKIDNQFYKIANK